MPAFVEIDHIDKIFPLPNGGQYIALKGIELKVQQGEFVTLIGHSGCGKSTLLNIVAGLEQPTIGGVVLENKEIRRPGPDRMVVFQNYSLLPWKTVRQNIALSVETALKHLPKPEQRDIIDRNIELVGLQAAADKYPKELSGGMKQRVAIARALAIRPKVLLLDEPFGALDALTRGNLQEQLMQICQENLVTAIMVTHDVDEALLLSDRVVMLTNGPEAHIGQILEVSIPRPRHRLEVLKHPQYYHLRNQIIYFLNQQKRAKRQQPSSAKRSTLATSPRTLEKTTLEIGFLPLTDCAPLIVAQAKGFFQKHGLEQVTLSRQPSWQAIHEGIVSGRLDASQMVASMPLSMTLGVGGQQPQPTITSLVLSRNGNAITFSRQLYDQGVRSLADFKASLAQTPDRVHVLGVPHTASMQNLLLRYWLASGGIDPDQDVSLTAISPDQLFDNLKAGNIDGYCVGAPWNARAVHEGIGVVMTTDLDIWSGHPEKVLGVREDWAEAHPETHLALVKALMEACEYCDDRRHREEILQLICQPEYVGSDPAYTRSGFIGPYDLGNGQEIANHTRYNRFYADQSNCPGRVEGLWILTQLARWGMTPFPKNWIEILERVRRVDLFGAAARELGWPDIEPDRAAFALFDKVIFNPDDPIGYLKRLSITRPVSVEEILIDVPTSSKSF